MTKVYTEYVNGKSKVDEEEGNFWYTKPGPHQYQGIFSTVSRIDQAQSYRSTMNVRHARLYSDLEMLGMSVYLTGSIGNVSNNTLSPNRITYNVVKSCVDTAASKIGKYKPKPQFLTSGGDYTLKDRSKKLTKYVEGVFYGAKYYETAVKVFIDGLVFGTGAMKFYKQDGQIHCERVIPEEIKVDDNDAVYGKPKSLYQVKQVPRASLMDKYPEHAMAIRSASSSTPDTSTVDLVRVVEAWHLGKNGCHTVAIENKTLYSEKWEKSYFPFVFYRWSDRLTGFFGQGLAEELTGVQIEINQILMNIQKALKLVAVPRVAVEGEAKISTAQITSEVASIIKYATGSRPPTFFTATGMNAEVYNHLKWLIQSAYEKTGISQLSATSKKPAGLDSGVALREYNDIESERFSLTSDAYTQMALEAAKIIIDMSKDLYSENKNLSVNVPGKDFIETIKWKDVDLPNEKFIMKAFPTNLLPSTPAGRIQKVQELIQAGWIDKEKGLELLDFPDLESFESLETANNTLIEKNINKMLTDGEYLPPEPQMDLVVAAKMAHKHYLLGRVEGLDEENLELLLRFIDDADRLKKAKEAAAQPVMQAGAVPLANPEQPETSELLPIAPQQ